MIEIKDPYERGFIDGMQVAELSIKELTERVKQLEMELIALQ